MLTPTLVAVALGARVARRMLTPNQASAHKLILSTLATRVVGRMLTRELDRILGDVPPASGHQGGEADADTAPEGWAWC